MLALNIFDMPYKYYSITWYIPSSRFFRYEGFDLILNLALVQTLSYALIRLMREKRCEMEEIEERVTHCLLTSSSLKRLAEYKLAYSHILRISSSIRCSSRSCNTYRMTLVFPRTFASRISKVVLTVQQSPHTSCNSFTDPSKLAIAD